MDTLTDQLPPHLEPLLQPTPSGVAKLLAAWDGLQTETQIDILTRLGKFSSNDFPDHLRDKIERKAFDSGTAYIRYLAVRFRWKGLEGEWRTRITADPDPLVRYAIGDDYCLDDPDKFWALPHEARLRQVRYLGGFQYGQRIATAVHHAVENHLNAGRVSETELYDVLADYLLRTGITKKIGDAADSSDGGVALDATRDFDALWGLTLAVPQTIAALLVKALPAQAGIYSNIPTEVIAGMNDDQLTTLLYRQDVALPHVRKDLFKTADRGSRWLVRSAAISSHFCLDNSEFSQLVALPDDEKFEVLGVLATDTETLMLSHYESIGDILHEAKPCEARIAKSKCQSRLNHLADWPDWFQEKNLLELRLYLLACQMVDAEFRQSAPNAAGISGFPDAEREYLSQLVVLGDIWSTFLAFAKAWNSSYVWKHLEKHLPRLSIDDTVNDAVEQKLDEVLKALRERPVDSGAGTATSESLSQNDSVIEQKLEEILETLLNRSIDVPNIAVTDALLVAAEVVTNVAADVKTLRENDEDANIVIARVSALEKSNSKLRGLLWAVFVLTGIILLRTF